MTLHGVDPDAVVMATARDKKRLGSDPVRFVLLDGPGRPRIGQEVDNRALIGAVRYYDAQADDARHTLTVVRTAARYGAVVRSSSQAVASS